VKALITGGAGFIGVHLARAMLERGWRVDLVDNFTRGVLDAELDSLQGSGSVRLIERDLLAPDAFVGFDDDYDYVVHFAAIVGVSHVMGRPYDVLTDNVLMTSHVISWARRQPRLQRFLFASTSEVYAGTLTHLGDPIPTPEAVVLTLSDLGEPRTSYLLSKIYGEAMCHHAGIPFTIFRPHNVYGPRMGLSHVIPELLQRAHAAAEGESVEVFSVDHRRTFCYVEDAVEMMLRAAESAAAAGETLNIGNDAPEVTIGELALLVVKTVGKRLEIVPLPPTPGSPARRRPDMTKTSALTGYEPTVSLERGIERTYDWYRTRVFEAEGIVAR
jgi:nucleoside-diphosphate-sugar epimerase